MRQRSPEFYLTRARRLAARRGGMLLSTRYVGDTAKLRFRCMKGHRFSLSSGDLLQGHWCSLCGIERRSSLGRPAMLARLRRLVGAKGGVLLSSGYVNNLTRLHYRCDKGHEWDAVAASLFKGRWCPECAGRAHGEARRIAVLGRLRERARTTGNTLLPPGFVGASTRIFLRCARGHIWQTLYRSFEAGTGCPKCRENELLDKLRARAERWNGTCLAKSAKNVLQELPWRCAQGHRFMAPAERVLRGGWCQRCRSLTAGSLERMIQLARERGGLCLSPRYVDATTRLRWRCRENHEWSADPGSVVQGSWCPTCRRRGGHSRARLSIEIMRETAEQRGGACLSSEYHASKAHLRWRCARGHTWDAIPARIRQGDWCPVCSHAVRGTLEGMRALAFEQGGRCVSTAWNDHREPLRFECARGHRFSMNPKVVKTGVWCPICAGRKVPTTAILS